MTWTTYDDDISYDAAIPYDGQDMSSADAAGYLLMHAPTHKRRPETDDEDALIAWYVMEMMDE